MDDENLARIAERIARATEAYGREVHGSARQAQWECEDGWVVIYTTTRVQGGPHHGNFLAQLFRPPKKGSSTYVQEDRRICATRKEAKARAVTWYREHSPKWDAKYPQAATT